MWTESRKLNIPAKLDAWATTKAMAYLALHAPGFLLLNTWKTTWTELLKDHSPTSEWTTVGGKSRNKKQQSKSKTVKKSSIPVIPTIDEETAEDYDMTASGASVRPTEADNVSKASTTGKQSVLIPTLNVPMNDGTNRITIRWKAIIDASKVSSQSSKMNLEVYNLLNELFSDDDGHLYQWGTNGIDKFNQISNMTPAQVRSFICPSIQIIPDRSLVIIPLRFGFSDPSLAT